MPPIYYSFFVPALFVWLWSTGFIGAKYGLPYAEPFTLLLIRMLLTLVPLAILAVAMKSRWPGWRGAGHLAITGLLVQGTYLGGVFYAIDQGMPSGLVSLIVGLQPLVTALAAVLILRESVAGRQWLGLVMGLVDTRETRSQFVDILIHAHVGPTLPTILYLWVGETSGDPCPRRCPPEPHSSRCIKTSPDSTCST